MSSVTTARNLQGEQFPPIRRTGRAAAWVESPLQLLSAVEAHEAGILGTSTLVHSRSDAQGMPTALDAILGQSMPEGLMLATASTTIPSARNRAVERWVVGDAYSGKAQFELARGIAAEEVVILDDGLATVNFLQTLVRPRATPLIRPRVRPTPVRIALGLAAWRRLRDLTRTGRLTVFTALEIPLPVAKAFEALGGTLIRHRFDWLSRQPITERIAEPTVVVGSALAADGLIREQAYLEWVNGLTAAGPLRYFPHRREDAALLARLEQNPGIRLQRHNLPIEMRLRGLGSGQRVVSLPSTAVSSLRLVLGSNAVDLRFHPVPGSWWTAQAPARLRQHLNGVLDTVQQ